MLPQGNRTVLRWLVSANLPTQKPATQQFVVLPMTALSQYNELLCCEVTQQYSHTEHHNTTKCCVVGFCVGTFVVLSYLIHNTTNCCVARSGSQFATEVELIL